MSLAIVAVAVTIVAMAATGVMQAAAVTTGADMIVDALSEGRSAAVAQNTTVEVRFYSLSSSGGGTPVYSALQLHWLKADQTTPAVAVPLLLPSGAVIDATAVHSTLIAANSQTATADAGDRLLNAGTRVFHFLPDGSTDLNPATSWFLTVRAATQSDPAHFPANWACVTIDATTGRAQIYRP